MKKSTHLMNHLICYLNKNGEFFLIRSIAMIRINEGTSLHDEFFHSININDNAFSAVNSIRHAIVMKITNILRIENLCLHTSYSFR